MADYTEEVRRTHGLAMHIRVGLNSGEVVVRTIGNDLHMDYSAVGQTTHLAARMEQLATPGSVCLTASTLRLVEGLVEVKPLGAQKDTLFLASPYAYLVAIFQPVVEALCQELRVVTFDPRGTGASDPAPEQYPRDLRVEDLRAVIEALASGPVIAVGLSQSGNHMARLAWTYPSLFKKLVLVGTPPGAREQLGADHLRWPEKRIRQRQAIAHGDFSELEDYFTFHSAGIFSEPEARDLAEEFYRTSMHLPRNVLRNFAGGIFEPDYNIVPLLSDIHVPTLVTSGTDDRLVPYATARYIAERIPGAQLYAFEGKGHLPMFTATHEFCEVLRHFVRTGTIPTTRHTDA